MTAFHINDYVAIRYADDHPGGPGPHFGTVTHIRDGGNFLVILTADGQILGADLRVEAVTLIRATNKESPSPLPGQIPLPGFPGQIRLPGF